MFLHEKIFKIFEKFVKKLFTKLKNYKYLKKMCRIIVLLLKVNNIFNNFLFIFHLNNDILWKHFAKVILEPILELFFSKIRISFYQKFSTDL